MNPGIHRPTTQLAMMPKGLLGVPRPVPMPDRYWHPEALEWSVRVAANGGVVSTAVLRAVSAFCWGIDEAGIRDRFARLNPFAGGNLSGALVPLYRSFSYGGTVIGNATDTNVNFVNADFTATGATGGLKSNASKYLNTGLPANAIATDNLHLGIGLVTANTQGGNRSAIGAFSGGNIVGIACSSSNRLAGIFGSFTNTATHCGPSTSAAQLQPGNLIAAYPSFYRNGTIEGASASSFGQYGLSNPIFVFGLSTSASGLTDPVDARLNWYSIGATMTAAQVASYDAAIASLRVALGRL